MGLITRSVAHGRFQSLGRLACSTVSKFSRSFSSFPNHRSSSEKRVNVYAAPQLKSAEGVGMLRTRVDRVWDRVIDEFAEDHDIESCIVHVGIGNRCRDHSR